MSELVPLYLPQIIIYVSGIIRGWLLIAISGHHKVVSLITFRHIDQIERMVALNANFARSQLLDFQITVWKISFYERRLFHLTITSSKSLMISWSLRLVVNRKCEIIIVPNLKVMRVLDHLFIVSIWRMHYLLNYLIILNCNLLTQRNFLEICSLFHWLMNFDWSKLLVARIVQLISRWLKVTL